MKFLRIFESLTGSTIQDDQSLVIDFAPVNGEADATHVKRRLAKARRRNRKEFITAIHVQRVKPNTHLLDELNQKSLAARNPAKRASSVTSIARGRRRT